MAVLRGRVGLGEAGGAHYLGVVPLFDSLLIAIREGREAGWRPLEPVIPPKHPNAKQTLERVRQALVRVGKTVPEFDTKSEPLATTDPLDIGGPLG